MPSSPLASHRRLAALIVAPLMLAPLALAAPAAAVSPDLVISQVYGGGGNAGATYTNDFIELYNRGPATVDLTGRSVQYASAAGFTWQVTTLTGSLAAGQHYLVREGQGAGGSTPLPTPDATGNIAMSATSGKVALANTTVALECGTDCDSAAGVVDFVGYAVANDSEGAPAPALTNTTAALRAAGGATDTDSNSADFTAGPPNPRNSGGTDPVDTAPGVLSTAPVNGATGVAVDGNLTVTFSEGVALAPGAVTLDCAGDRPVTVTGGPAAWTVNPTVDLPLNQGCTATVAAAGVSDVDGVDPPDQMAADHSWTFTTTANAPSCEDPETHTVSEVQGSGAASPVVDTVVTVQAVVTAIRPGLSGFFVQDEAADADASDETSEGVFVRTAAPAGVKVGDVVQVTGGVREFTGSGSSQTQISDQVSVLDCGAGVLPPAAVLQLPVTAPGDFEHFEGMRVTMPQPMVISEYFNFARFNEVVVGLPPAGRARFDTPTAVVEPGAAAIDLAAEYALRRITVDDGRGSQNSSPPVFPGTVDTPFTLDNTFRGGDTLTGITGVVEHTFGLYRVHPTEDADYAAVNPRPTSPPEVGGDLEVASFNVLNYFLTLDNGTDDICSPGLDQECRGADNPGELDRQRTKIVSAIASLDADIVGLMEMENTPGVEPAADLVDGLNAATSPGTYAYLDTGVIGTDAIRLGFLYQPGSVEPVGAHAVLDSTVDPRFIDDLNRPALAQTFEQAGTAHQVTVAVNHLKSKGSACTGDPDTGDGAGNCNVTRTNAAMALADWLATDPTGSGDPDSLIIGDLNSYDHEDPVDALVAAGYTDLLKQYGGEFAHSYVFDGQVGYLDHGLASESLLPQVTGAADWHLNSDEPPILDYDTDFKGPAEDALFEPNGFRSSDHDPVLIGLDLGADQPVVIDVVGNGSVSCAGLSSVTVTFSDASPADTHDATVVWGDGTTETLADVSSPFTASHDYARAGAYTASVTVTDSVGNTSGARTADLVVDYTVVGDGLRPPLDSSRTTTFPFRSVIPVWVAFRDCDNSRPRDLAPTLTVSKPGFSKGFGTLRFLLGQYVTLLPTGSLPGRDTYTVTVTVPETGQTVNATVRLR